MLKLARVCCSDCHLQLEPSDIVTIDIAYTLTHDFCEPTGLDVMATGTYEEIVESYPYF